MRERFLVGDFEREEVVVRGQGGKFGVLVGSFGEDEGDAAEDGEAFEGREGFAVCGLKGFLGWDGIGEVGGDFPGYGVVESDGIVAEFVEEGERLREMRVGGFPGDVQVVEHIGCCCVREVQCMTFLHVKENIEVADANGSGPGR